jgi:hypothetical protein
VTNTVPASSNHSRLDRGTAPKSVEQENTQLRRRVRELEEEFRRGDALAGHRARAGRA